MLVHFRAALAILCGILTIKFGEADTLNSIFDLSIDPYEDNNVYGSEDYADVLLKLEDRRKYWQALTMPANSPDTSNQKPQWNKCGRICTWINENDEDVQAKSIEPKYSYSEAPHIVYVLVDDWGYNDFGVRSTYLSWTTPNIDRLASEGVLLENYYTNNLCSPSRASLLTGRYALRTGVYFDDDELPLTETTLAEELKSAGYRNYIVGKWHLGQSAKSLYPTNRGFDYFYGYMSGVETYWTKEHNGYTDLFENTDFVTDPDELDEDYHSGFLYQAKVEEVIENHAKDYADTPMFLYYAMHLVHEPWTAPDIYLQRCDRNIEYYMSDDEHYTKTNAVYNYCGMNLMMDEAIANLTCTLNRVGFADNTILIIAGDNGAHEDIPGGNYPYKGWKETSMRGAFANTAIIHSNLIPSTSRGATYSQNVHITDWLPTLMGLATNRQWTGSYSGADLDGVDFWDAMLNNEASGREEMVLTSYATGQFVMHLKDIKYLWDYKTSDLLGPTVYFNKDLDPRKSKRQCVDATLLEPYTPFPNAITRLTAVYNAMMMTSDTTSAVDLTFTVFILVALIAVVAVALLIAYHAARIKQQGLDSQQDYNRYHRSKNGHHHHHEHQPRNTEADPLL
jgi:arylsulfatase A-like enzyme